MALSRLGLLDLQNCRVFVAVLSRIMHRHHSACKTLGWCSIPPLTTPRSSWESFSFGDISTMNHRYWISCLMRVSLWIHWRSMHVGQIAYAHALYLAQLCRHNVFACAAQPWVAWAWASGGWGAICIQHSPQNSYFNLLTTTPFAPLHSYNTAHTQATQLLQGVTICNQAT